MYSSKCLVHTQSYGLHHDGCNTRRLYKHPLGISSIKYPYLHHGTFSFFLITTLHKFGTTFLTVHNRSCSELDHLHKYPSEIHVITLMHEITNL